MLLLLAFSFVFLCSYLFKSDMNHFQVSAAVLKQTAYEEDGAKTDTIHSHPYLHYSLNRCNHLICRFNRFSSYFTVHSDIFLFCALFIRLNDKKARITEEKKSRALLKMHKVSKYLFNLTENIKWDFLQLMTNSTKLNYVGELRHFPFSYNDHFRFFIH